MSLSRSLTSSLLGLTAALLLLPDAGAQEASSEKPDEVPPTGSEETAQEEETPHELESIIVEAPLIETNGPPPTTSTTLSSEDLEHMEEDDVHQVLLKVPGVQIRGEDGMGLRPNIGIRGTSPNRSAKVTLMEDGVLLGPAPYSAPPAYYFPLVTRMSAVEVYKGGSQILYGPRALGGAINLVTKEIPDGWGGDADVAMGQFGYKKLHARVGYGGERSGYLLEGIHVDSTGFKELDGGGDTGFNKNEFMAKWRFNSDPNAEVLHRLDAKFGFSTETSDETYLGLTDEDFEKTPYRRYVASSLDQMNWYRGQAQLSYSVFPSDTVEFQVTGYRNQFTRDWFKVDAMGGASLDDILANPNTGLNRIYYSVLTGQTDSASNDELILHADNKRWYVSQGLASHLRAFLETGKVSHEVEAGVRLHYDEVNRHHTRHTYQMVGASDDSLGHLSKVDVPVSDLAKNQGQTHAISIHAVDTIAIDALTLNPGLRTELVWTNFEDEMEPRGNNHRFQVGLLPGLGAHYAFDGGFGALAGIYRGFGPVAPQALQSNSEGEETSPKPESSITYEAGGRFDTPVLHTELIGYFVDYQNLTADCSGSGGCSSDLDGTQFDGDRVFVWGLEALAAKEWHSGNLSIPARATYTLSLSSFRTEFESANPEWGDVEIGDALPYLPVHQATLGLGLEHENFWGIDSSATFVSEAREQAGSGPISDDLHTDGYALFGLAARIRAVEHLWFYVRGTNIFDATYLTSRRPHGARPGAPRWFHIGFKIE